ncbi:MAG TPA: spore coat protein CotH [Prolixibacteraceae bacterium]|nr:spore coat protein CotH [Prolixibacteraceae bacterium]
MTKFPIYIFLISLLTILTVSCQKNNDLEGYKPEDKKTALTDSLTYNPDWTYLSHGKANPDYSVIFQQSSVNKIELIMTLAQWNSIKTNMKNLYGSDFGSNTGGAPPGGGLSDVETDYVDVLLKFKNKVWKNVGFRLKGNSSLNSAWKQGNYKLPFKLNFDKFEDTYPGTNNQHFYGFKELSFSPGFKDQTLMREKLAADIFRMVGIPAAQTAFYQVFIDFGSGLKYCGIYAAVELPEDHMIKVQFGEEKGNIYKPESKFNHFIQSEFDKKNNETEADFSDVKAMITALNSNLRTTSPAQWRTGLEAVFNVGHFIKYLAVNNAIVNWDSYGIMAHNYYLYNHSVKKLIWIPWDLNESLSGSPGITGTPSGGNPPGPSGRSGLSLSMNEVGMDWPLIRYIANDEVYMLKYKTSLKQFGENVFTETAMNTLIDKYNTMISTYAIGAEGEKPGYTYLTGSISYTNAVSELKAHVSARRKLISNYVP